MRWDIFCTVIDNFGDAGVCWRLARQLVREHGLSVRLCIDDLHCLARLAPGIDTNAAQQTREGITLWHWRSGTAPDTPGDVVLNAFACRLPPAYLADMARRPRPPVWINLDYLSAEDWVEGCHGLTSPHPPLNEFFFYPGFTTKTGGLLREADLLTRRDAFQHDPTAQARLWTALGIATPVEGSLRTSLFAYENPALPALLDAWAAHPTPIWCGVPEGRIWNTLAAWHGGLPVRGRPISRGALTVVPLPFMPQDTYDHLLWACDLNIVRGEDSFVRAQWAAAPFLWHIYHQEADAHLPKLDAFLRRYCATLPPSSGNALADFHHAWNAHDSAGVATAWPLLAATLPALTHHARDWSAQHALQSDLASNLVTFATNRL